MLKQIIQSIIREDTTEQLEDVFDGISRAGYGREPQRDASRDYC
jgi:hypothetical protein